MKGGGGLHRATVTEDDLRPVTRRLKNGLRRHAACIIHRRSSGRRETVQGQKVEINRERREIGDYAIVSLAFERGRGAKRSARRLYSGVRKGVSRIIQRWNLLRALNRTVMHRWRTLYRTPHASRIDYLGAIRRTFSARFKLFIKTRDETIFLNFSLLRKITRYLEISSNKIIFSFYFYTRLPFLIIFFKPDSFFSRSRVRLGCWTSKKKYREREGIPREGRGKAGL